MTVPVTFVNDSMINMVKTKEIVKVIETSSSKRRDLTPVKHGYAPERRPSKKQKLQCLIHKDKHPDNYL